MHKKRRNRVMLLDENVEEAILTVSDLALKFSGKHMASVVADVTLAIRDQQHVDDEDWP